MYPDLNTNFLQYERIVSSIREYQKKCRIKLSKDYKINDTKAIQIIRKGNKAVTLQLYDSTKPPTAVGNWNKKYNIELEWDVIFSKCAKTSNDIKLRWFQARLIHRILPTNKFLFFCKIKESPMCTFCHVEEESILHLFWECPVVLTFWEKIERLLQEKCHICARLKISEQLVIFGSEKNIHTDKILDFIIMLGKFFIYKCRFKNTCPTAEGFVAFLKLRYADEIYTSKVYLDFENFQKKWMPYDNIFCNT